MAVQFDGCSITTDLNSKVRRFAYLVSVFVAAGSSGSTVEQVRI